METLTLPVNQVAFFLGVSLAISGVANYHNHRMNLVGN